MRLLDEQDTRTPLFGVRRMPVGLRQPGSPVQTTRVARVLQTMGLETLYPQPRMRQPQPGPRVYPSVLRGVPITQVHHVWSTASTSVRRHGGFLSLVAVMDWCSRDVRSWAVSIIMEVGCCVEALAQALGVATPHSFHRDQGTQCTSLELTGR